MSKKNKEIKHIDLREIEDPSFLKDLSYKELDVLCEDIRKYIIDVTSKNGGHLSANLGSVESTVALCRCFDFTKDKIIFDVGHQCYTYKILTGRSLERLRKSDGPSGFQRRHESRFDHFEAGHSSTSISAATGMAIARDLNKEKYEVVSYIGDASIANGLAMEGLNNLSNGNHKVILILNDNDMSITKPIGGLSRSFRSLSNSILYRRSKNAYQRFLKKNRLGRFTLRWTGAVKNWFKRHLVAINIFDNIGIAYVGPIDGHDIKAMEKAIIKAKKYEKSSVIHIKTIKGKGYKYAENDDSGAWHGVGKFDVESGEQIKDLNLVSWSKVVSDNLNDFMSENEDAVLICPATGVGSSLTEVFNKYPKRCIDVGIAEEHALTLAGGLSASGKHPIVSIYSTFLQRAFDELSHDIARMKLNATILIDRSGLVGEDGNTHQGIYDESYLLSVPNTVVTMPIQSSEVYSLIKESKNDHGVFCIRYPRAKLAPSNERIEVPFGKWRKELSGEGTAIVSVGPITLDLKKALEDEHKNVTLYSAIYLKPMDEVVVDEELLKYKQIIIYDAYAIENGFAQALAERLLVFGYKGKVVIKSIPDVFVGHASQEEQLNKYQINVADIIKLL